MIRYNGLIGKMSEQGLNKTELAGRLGLSSRTVAKIAKGEKLSKTTMQRIADLLECGISDLYAEVSDNPILQILREEKAAKISGGLYHELQIRMTYNSNHIEGSRLTEEQTRQIFETDTIDGGDGIPVYDILETVNHFRAIDYVIDVAEDVLSEDIIKHLHYIIEHDTKDSELAWFAVGDYKKRANVVGGRETAKPAEVPDKMQKMLIAYNSKDEISINDIIELHVDFEYIHPFQDGNGRVGRLAAFKECLKHSIVPFIIIEDEKKHFYYRGLDKWKEERGWLTDTCLDGQDMFIRLLNILGIEY